MRIDPTRLIRLAVLIDKKSIRKAADTLGVSQPALSQSIAQFESEVGVQLINRTPGGIEPTIYGEALYKHAKAIDWELAQAGQRIAELARGSLGSVPVGVSGGAAMLLASQAIGRLQASRPGAKLRIVEELTNRLLLSHLHNRTLDLVISARPSDLELQGVRAVRLFSVTTVACTRTGHPLGNDLNLKNLLEFPFVCPSEPELLSNIRTIFSNEGLEIPLDKMIACNSLAVAKEIVRGSDAFSIFSDLWIRKEFEAGDFLAANLPNQKVSWCYLVSRAEYEPTDMILSFIDEIFAVCEEWGIPIDTDAKRYRERVSRNIVH